MGPVCGRCGSADAVEWDDDLFACHPCGNRYSEIIYDYEGASMDDYASWLGLMFTTDLANAWWRVGK